jgi:hypothetical protein
LAKNRVIPLALTCKHGKKKNEECDECAGGFDNASPQIMDPEQSKLYALAAKLPRKHPMRFALLYGVGTKRLADWGKRLVGEPSADKMTAKTQRAIRLEAELLAFERWQTAFMDDGTTEHVMYQNHSPRRNPNVEARRRHLQSERQLTQEAPAERRVSEK